MRWSCRVANRLLIVFIVGGMVTLSVLSGVPAAAPPDNVNAYPPEVQELLDTTYLGHAAEFPDPGEPYVVLKKYVERDTHKFLRGDVPQVQELDREIKEWRGLARAFPQSRHALVGLAQHYKIKAELSQDEALLTQAADFYIRAAEIGLEHGRIRYIREISELLVALSDKAWLDRVFGRILALPRELDPNYYYGALVSYADGLARLNDDRA